MHDTIEADVGRPDDARATVRPSFVRRVDVGEGSSISLNMKGLLVSRLRLRGLALSIFTLKASAPRPWRQSVPLCLGAWCALWLQTWSHGQGD